MTAATTIEPTSKCFNCNKQVDISMIDLFPDKKSFCSSSCYKKYTLIKRNTKKFSELQKICTTCKNTFHQKPFMQVGDNKHFCKPSCFHQWLNTSVVKFKEAMDKAAVFNSKKKLNFKTTKNIYFG